MFKNKSFFICLLIIPVLFTSCFEVIEDVSIGKNGAGNMKLTVNFSQSRTRLAAIMLMDSINGYKVPGKQEIQREMEKTVAQLEKMRGISNVKNTLDFTNFIATISFSFTDAEDINNLTRTILEQYKVKGTNAAIYRYNKEKASFSREYSYSSNIREQYNQLSGRDKEIFRAASYVSIFRFENTITGYSNKQARLSQNQLAIMQRCPVLDLINGNINISNQVQLLK